MPSGFPGPIRTIADLFAAGAQFIAERIYQGASTIGRLVTAFQSRYGQQYQATNQVAGQFGARAADAVSAAARLSTGQTVSPADIPINNSPSMTGQFAYDTIIVHRINDPTKPSGKAEIRERITVRSDAPLTLAELRDVAEGIARDQRRDINSPEILKIIQSAGLLGDMSFEQVISAYRGLGTR